MFLPVDEKQFKFWILPRNGLPDINIAKRFGVSRQAVSRALLSMDKRIEKILLGMAKANRIDVEKLDSIHSIIFLSNLGTQYSWKFMLLLLLLLLLIPGDLNINERVEF